MKKNTMELLKKHNSYIDALQEAITEWKNALNMEDKKNYIIMIGEIGNEIHKTNKRIL